jgi:ethanolamine-phosphate cytidylyltransferase
MPLDYDPYEDAKAMGIFQEVGEHPFSGVNAGEIVMRIMKGREEFEERQRRKGQKAVGEQAAREREILEQQMMEAEKDRRK